MISSVSIIHSDSVCRTLLGDNPTRLETIYLPIMTNTNNKKVDELNVYNGVRNQNKPQHMGKPNICIVDPFFLYILNFKLEADM